MDADIIHTHTAQVFQLCAELNQILTEREGIGVETVKVTGKAAAEQCFQREFGERRQIAPLIFRDGGLGEHNGTETTHSEDRGDQCAVQDGQKAMKRRFFHMTFLLSQKR